jgi:hypothetical protein
MILIVETDDFRGDHAADVELTVTIADSEPVSKIREIAHKYKLYTGTDATIRIIPEAIPEDGQRGNDEL